MEKGRNKIILLAGVIFLSFIFFWTGSQKDNTDSKGQTDNTIPISIGQTHLQALIADTLATRALGLGNRSNIASDQAMLFIFDTSDRYGFWMKDMRFPIDMLWLD